MLIILEYYQITHFPRVINAYKYEKPLFIERANSRNKKHFVTGPGSTEYQKIFNCNKIKTIRNREVQ